MSHALNTTCSHVNFSTFSLIFEKYLGSVEFPRTSNIMHIEYMSPDVCSCYTVSLNSEHFLLEAYLFVYLINEMYFRKEIHFFATTTFSSLF